MATQLLNHAFARLAIINRGEPALRLLRAAADYALRTQTHVGTIALYTDPDKHSVYVRRANVAYHLGPALEPQADGSLASRYLNFAALEKALVETRATAAWVGWGFVAERAEFADLCAKLGIVFIGPTASAMRTLGDKIASKRLAESARVPVAPWTGGPVESREAAERWVKEHGLPVMIKATAGGGGRGVRRVDELSALPAAFNAARDEAQKAFGNGDVYLERVIEGARHVEVQIVADTHGTTWAAGLRDCTVQRRHQKIIEEGPPATLGENARAALADAAVRLAVAARYTSLGTVEFLYEPQTQKFYFMEMNTRLQVEHPVTELTTGLDLVGLQLAIAAGEKIAPMAPKTVGHAIEVRLCAEDPRRDFAPAPGKLVRFAMPAGPNVRVDSGYAEGEEVPSEFDSMMAKIIAFGPTRNEALLALRRALRETQVFVQGGASNRAFLSAILQSASFVDDRTDTRWLDRSAKDLFTVPPETFTQLAVCFAAIDVYRAERAAEIGRLLERVRRGRFELGEDRPFEITLSAQDRSYTILVVQSAPEQFQARLAEQWFDITVQTHTPQERVAIVGGVRLPHRVFADARGISIEIEEHSVFVALPQGNRVTAPAPGLVQRILVEPGDAVAPGQLIVVLEAMKTEVYVRATTSGRVAKRVVSAGAQVKGGATLLELDSEGAGGPQKDERAHAASPFATADPLPIELLERLLRGFDGTAVDRKRAAELAGAAPQGVDALVLLVPLLQQIGALLELYMHRTRRIDGATQELSTPTALITLLRGGRDAVKLEPRFLELLDRVIAGVGYDPLSPATWPEALERTQRAYERVNELGPIIASALGLWHDNHDQLSVEQRRAYKAALDLLVVATPKELAVLSDAARRARYLDFERPSDESHRQTNDWAVSELLGNMLRESTESWPPHTLDAIATSAEPVIGTVAQKLGQKGGPRLLLEIFVRRFYGAVRNIGEVNHASAGPIHFAQTSFEFRGKRRNIIAIVCTTADVAKLSSAIADSKALKDTDNECLIDLMLADGLTAEAPELAWVAAALPPVVRVCIMRLAPEKSAVASYRTFGRRDAGFSEITLLADVHPMLAGRFDLWRLRQFDTKRLPAGEDVLVVAATAKDNSEDQRLFAFINLRGASLVRLETLLVEATTSMSTYLDQRPDSLARWNRITILINDDTQPKLEELNTLFARLSHQFLLVHLEKLVVLCGDKAFHFAFDGKGFARVRVGDPSSVPIRTLSRYTQRVMRLRRRGIAYAYEIIRLLTPSEPNPLTRIPPGRFTELDLEAKSGALVAVERPPGENTCGVVIGIAANMTQKFPDGMHRVVILGDASHDMGSLAEPECRRIIAAINLAESERVPLEWFAMSAGAAITMTTGTENLDWTARVLRRIIEFTQKGGEINVVVDAINVGAQSYWNAEATMLMHTKGALIMTPEGAMVLTGKKALEFSGAVSAADHQGIGGVERIMGPNGEAQYRAKDLSDAIATLFRYYALSYVAPGETRVRRRPTTDPKDRDIGASPHHPSDEFKTIGEVFSEQKNPGRKRPFDVRSVMHALSDEGAESLERWANMREAESAIVMDTHIGGIAASLIGIEAKSITRQGFVAGDGPDTFAPGTLYPQASKKLARALNATSGRRPVVLLANLSGFDGSPESLRRLQLELGAEIGRAIVNFTGAIIFAVLTRFHGGAYVVFSKALNDRLYSIALPGAYASVIGGAAAAAVVFRQEVKKRTAADPRVIALRKELEADPSAKPSSAMQQLLEVTEREKLGALAAEFDAYHDVNRAVRVGSLDAVVPLERLRAAIVEALEKSATRG